MIKWCNGDPVKVQTGYGFEMLILKLNRISSNSGQIEMIDKTGCRYYTNKSRVDIIVPEGLNPENMRELMIIGPEDQYKEPPPKKTIERVKYRPKKYRSQQAKSKAYKR